MKTINSNTVLKTWYRNIAENLRPAPNLCSYLFILYNILLIVEFHFIAITIYCLSTSA